MSVKGCKIGEKCMKYAIEFTQKLMLAYAEICRPLCHELNIPQTAFDILLFLANNPEYRTARDIVEIRKIKANLVSVNIDKLVKEGYLERTPAAQDRRKIFLNCTEKAAPIIEKGKELQENFVKALFSDISNTQVDLFFQTLERVNSNLDTLYTFE